MDFLGKIGEASGHLGRYEMKNLKSYLPPVDKSVSV